MISQMLVKAGPADTNEASGRNLALGKNYGWRGCDASNIKADPDDPYKIVRCDSEGRKQLTDGYYAQAAPDAKAPTGFLARRL